LKTILIAALTALCVSAAFLWLLRPGTISPHEEAGTAEALAAVDADGKRIGPLAGASTSLTEAQVAIDTPAGLVIAGLRPGRFVHATRPFVYFDQSNCGGSPFLGVGNEPAEFGLKAAIAGDAQTLYVARPGGPQLLPVKSVLRETACEPFEHEIHAVAAQRVMDLAEVYRAPYRIERAGREGDSR
jgi:hypothetical protein